MIEKHIITSNPVEGNSCEIALLPLIAEYVPSLITMLNEEDIAKWFPFHSPFDESQANHILELAQNKQNDYCVWMIKAEDNIVGATIMQSQFHPGCLQVGYWVAPEFHRRGYAYAAVQMMCNTAYVQFGAERLQAQVHTDNDASIALLKKLGFKRESFMKLGAAKTNDTPADCYMYVQFKSELIG